MRASGFDSTGPNLAKSTSGQAGRLNGSAPPALAPVAAGTPASAPFTKLCTSAGRMRPFGPLACTRARSTPSSRANLRAEGLACGLAEVSARGSRGTGRVGGGGAGAGVAAFGDAAGFCGSLAAPAAPAVFSARIGEPLETLSPTLTLSSFTTPAPGDGISIVAWSD